MSSLDDLFDAAEGKKPKSGSPDLDALFDVAEEKPDPLAQFMARPGDRIPGIPNVEDATQQIRVGQPRTLPPPPSGATGSWAGGATGSWEPNPQPVFPMIQQPRREAQPPPQGFMGNLARAALPATTGAPMQERGVMVPDDFGGYKPDTIMASSAGPLDLMGDIFGAPVRGAGTVLDPVLPWQARGEGQTMLQGMQDPETGLARPAREALGKVIASAWEKATDEDRPYIERVGQALLAEAGGLGFLGAATVEDPTFMGPLAAGTKTGRAAMDLAGRGLERVGADQMTRVMKPGIPVERKGYDTQNIFKHDVGGSPKVVFEKSKQKIKELSAELGRRIREGADEGQRVNMYDAIDQAVADVRANPGASADNVAMAEDLERQVARMKSRARQISRSSNAADGNLDLLQAQAFKQDLGHRGAWRHIAERRGIPLNAKESAESRVAEAVYNHLNEIIDEAAPAGVRDVNRALSELIPVNQAAGHRQIIEGRGNLLNMTDLLGAVGTAANPKFWPMLAVGRLSKSGTLANQIYKLGSKLRTAKTSAEKARYLAAIQKLGLTEQEVEDGLRLIEESGGLEAFKGQDLRIREGEAGAGTEMPPNAVPFRRQGEAIQPAPPKRRTLPQEEGDEPTLYQEGEENLPVPADQTAEAYPGQRFERLPPVFTSGLRKKAMEVLKKNPKMLAADFLKALKGAGVKKDELKWTGLEKYLEDKASGMMANPNAPKPNTMEDWALKMESYYKPGREVKDPEGRQMVKVLDFNIERDDAGKVTNWKVTVQDPPKKEYTPVPQEEREALWMRMRNIRDELGSLRGEAANNDRIDALRAEQDKIADELDLGRFQGENTPEPRIHSYVPEEEDIQKFFEENPEAKAAYRSHFTTKAPGKPMVTQKEIEDFLEENQVELVEHRLGHVPEAEREAAQRRMETAREEYTKGAEELGRARTGTPEEQIRVPELLAAHQKRAKELEKLRGVAEPGEAQYHGYNIQKILGSTEKPAEYGNLLIGWNKKDRTLQLMGKEDLKDYQHGHWSDQDNVLGFVRFATHYTPDGKKVLFLEEIQSDWAQQAREMGHPGERPGDEKLLAENQKKLEDLPDTPETENERLALKKTIDRLNERLEKNRYNIPEAPYIGDTEGWTKLMIKRMLRYAAEHDFDHLAWTTGEQQAKRWNFSQVVDEIGWEKLPDGKYMISPRQNGRAVYAQGLDLSTPKTKAEVTDVIGHDMLARINAAEGTTGKLDATDFALGGEGHKASYNKILPGIVKDYLKKNKAWKASVEPMEIAVKKGQPPPPTRRRNTQNQTPDGMYEIRETEVDPAENGGDPIEWRIVDRRGNVLDDGFRSEDRALESDSWPQTNDTERYSIEERDPGDDGYEADVTYDIEEHQDGKWYIVDAQEEAEPIIPREQEILFPEIGRDLREERPKWEKGENGFDTEEEAQDALRELREDEDVDQREYWIVEDGGDDYGGPYTSESEAEDSDNFPQTNDYDAASVEPFYGDPYTEYYIVDEHGDQVDVGDEYWQDEDDAREEMMSHWRDEGHEEAYNERQGQQAALPAPEPEDNRIRSKQLGVRITPEMKHSLLTESQEYFQKKKGAIKGSFQKKRLNSVINLFKGRADATTWMHEHGHWLRAETLTPEQAETVLRWTGAPGWSRHAEEKFARGLERYFYNGIAPHKNLEKPFATMKEAFRKAYGEARGTEIGQDIPPEMRAVYDAIFLRGQKIRDVAKVQRLMAAAKRAGRNAPRVITLLQREVGRGYGGVGEKRQQREAEPAR